MFCSECGEKASGKFCWSCGKPLVQAAHPDQPMKEVTDAAIDWTALTNYEALIRVPEVRDRIARHANQSKRKLTGEQFLACCDAVIAPLTGGVPLTVIANIAQPLGEKLGLKTGKSRCERLAERPGTVLVAILSSLARNGHKLGEVQQLSDGCTLRAAMPSDLWSLKGELSVIVRAEGSTTAVEAGLTIPGQVYDWGKSQRALDQLFADIANLSKAA